MKNMANTLIAVLFIIALAGYSFCSFFIEPKISSVSALYKEGKNTAEFVDLPAFTYHLILNDKSKLGEYVVSGEEFESDIKYLHDNGYTPVLFSELKAYINGEGALPPKPVLITFDDGYYNNYLYAFPILKKYSSKANIALVGSYTEQYSKSGELSEYYTHLTYDHIKEMKESGLVEFGCHTYKLHSLSSQRKGADMIEGENTSIYKDVIQKDLSDNRKVIYDNTGVDMKFFVYPYGFMNEEIDKVIKDMGYCGSFSCKDGINKITKDPEELFRIKRYNRPSGKSSRLFFENILKR